MAVRLLRTGLGVRAAALALLAPSALAAAPPAGAAVGSGSPQRDIGYWGGYGAHGAFDSAQASWTVAEVSCRTHYEAYSTWVGMDGDGSQYLERTGVLTGCATGEPQYQAWYEVSFGHAVYYDDPVSAGDEFTASVTADGSMFTLTITDETKGWTESATTSVPSAPKAAAEAVISNIPGEGYPTIASVRFTDVTFDGRPLDSFSDLQKYKTRRGSSTIYAPTKIRHHTDFAVKPIN